MGLGPVLIILFLLIASLWSVFLGRSLTQLGARLAIVAAIVGIIYLGWRQLAKRHSEFRMGGAGESTIILMVVAVALIFVSDPIATSVGLTLVPQYSTLQLVGGTEFDLANTQIAALFLALALILLGLLLFRVRRKSK
jgi:hypothetical protein